MSFLGPNKLRGKRAFAFIRHYLWLTCSMSAGYGFCRHHFSTTFPPQIRHFSTTSPPYIRIVRRKLSSTELESVTSASSSTNLPSRSRSVIPYRLFTYQPRLVGQRPRGRWPTSLGTFCFYQLIEEKCLQGEVITTNHVRL